MSELIPRTTRTGHSAVVGMFPWVSERGDKPHDCALLWLRRLVMVHVNSMGTPGPTVWATHSNGPVLPAQAVSGCICWVCLSQSYYMRLALLSRSVREPARDRVVGGFPEVDRGITSAIKTQRRPPKSNFFVQVRPHFGVSVWIMVSSANINAESSCGQKPIEVLLQ